MDLSLITSAFYGCDGYDTGDEDGDDGCDDTCDEC